MFFLLSKILEFVLLPITWILILLMIGVFGLSKGWGRRYITASLVMMVFFSNPFFINEALDLWEIPAYNPDRIEEPFDVAILLGGSMRYYNDVLERPVYSQSVDRLLQTIDLYKRGKIKKILLSGGSGRVQHPHEKEAPIIKEVLLNAGIPEGDIILETASRNTRENALYSAQIIQKNMPGSGVLLITSAWHMRRSMACFAKVGMDVVPFPVDERSGDGTYTPDRLLIPASANMTRWAMLIHEWAGIIIYKTMGYI
jgi:uncharacterized SAM-binding protein YcdF (DUF218 family)